jgi:hypothetical protein
MDLQAVLLEEVARVQVNHALLSLGRAAPGSSTGWEALAQQSHEHVEESQHIMEGLRQIYANRVQSPAASSPGEVRSAVRTDFSNTTHAQLVKPRPKPGTGLRFCCFDPRDALQSEPPSMHDHLAVVAEELFNTLPVSPMAPPAKYELVKKSSRRLDSLEGAKASDTV